VQLRSQSHALQALSTIGEVAAPSGSGFADEPEPFVGLDKPPLLGHALKRIGGVICSPQIIVK
jgi:hypothetical protein